MIILQALDLSSPGNLGALGALGSFIAGFFLLALLIGLALYIYMALALMGIAKKTNTPNPWLAWIPIANFYLIAKMAGKSGHWTWLFVGALIPFVSSIASIAVLIVSIWFFWVIAERIDMPGWTSLLLLIPIINLIVLGIYAWHK